MKKIILLPVSFVLYTYIVFAQKPVAASQKGEVIYHVCQRSFYDSNGDLQGDLNGLRQKLGYLQELGITSILLLPLYDADFYHNYFANDFEKIDAEFGTMQDYIAFVKDVHSRGMKIYMDMETQYVTSKHLWWKDATGNPASPYSNYILFDDEAHTTPAPMIYGLRELKSYDGTVLKITTVNLKSKEVLDYNTRLFAYFIDPNNDGKFDDGVDGFRLDHAMDHLDGKPTLINLFREFWQPLITALKKINPQIRVVAEQADWGDYGFDYFANAGVDRMFGFGLLPAILSFDKQMLISKADTILGQCPSGKEQIIFLENHDLDRFASLEKNIQKQKLAAAIQLFIGGLPSLYYGQEIGMTGKGGFGIYGKSDGNDIPRREAFEWYQTGEGKGMALWYKNTGEWWEKSYLKPNDGISLEEQINDPRSLFNYYKKIIQIRQNNPALSNGSYANAANNNDKVFSFIRAYASEKVLVVANLSGEMQKASLKNGFKKYTRIYGSGNITQNVVELKPYEVTVWGIK